MLPQWLVGLAPRALAAEATVGAKGAEERVEARVAAAMAAATAAAATAAVRGAVVRAAVARGAGRAAVAKGEVVAVAVRAVAVAVMAVAVRAEEATAVVRVAVARAAGACLVDDSVARLGRHLDHAVDDHLLLRVAKAAMQARAGAVIPTAGCERSPLLFFYSRGACDWGRARAGALGEQLVLRDAVVDALPRRLRLGDLGWLVVGVCQVINSLQARWVTV